MRVALEVRQVEIDLGAHAVPRLGLQELLVEVLHHRLGPQRCQHANYDNQIFLQELAPAMSGLGFVDVHDVRSYRATKGAKAVS